MTTWMDRGWAKLAALAVLVSLTGCATNMKVPLKDARPSGIAYSNTAIDAQNLRFQDDRSAENKGKTLTGLIPMQLVLQDQPFDAFQYFSRNVGQELQSRGLKLNPTTSASDTPVVRLTHLQIENQRASGFSPFITFTTVKAQVQSATGTKNVVAYVKRAKVPVMTFDEIVDPTFNDALSVAMKEVAAKINQHAFKLSISNAEVQRLIAAVNKDAASRDSAYLDVYQLGFGNNLTAVEALTQWVKHPSEYVRLAAISSLGILQDPRSFSVLKSLYEAKGTLWQDRAMAAKAIGDLGTEEASAFLRQVKAEMASRTDKDAVWTRSLLDLYL